MHHQYGSGEIGRQVIDHSMQRAQAAGRGRYGDNVERGLPMNVRHGR
jgi:hypothetical protein